jgi:hypothetical protein
LNLSAGNTVSADTTQELERGYWPSYNVPYFDEVYNKTGYGMLRRHLRALGPEYKEVVTGLSYQLSSRAKILRRDSGEWDLPHGSQSLVSVR